MDTRGAIAIPMEFKRARSFSEGFAAAEVDAKRGYIDRTGIMVIDEQFSVTWLFSEGLVF